MIQWNESEVLIDRKSKFQGRAISIDSPDQVPQILEELVTTDKAVQKATHKTMYAWRTGRIETTSKGKEKKVVATNQGISDCGEGGAGMRIMTLLEHSSLVNVLVVVTRWYGGTALGPARFRHISTVAVESLRKGEFLKNQTESNDDSTGKKKGKKKK